MADYDSEKTYTLSDLKNWAYPGTSLAVLGYPIRHSISPQMHNTALAEIADADSRFKNWRYFRFEVHPDNLIESLPIFRQKGFHGLNLTVPHKTIAFDSLSTIDPDAQAIGAVNTLRLEKDAYIGYNTDGFGLANGIERELKRPTTGAHVALLGAGGAARAAAVQCLQSCCASLTIINRNQDRLARLIDSMQALAESNSIPLIGKSSSEPDLSLPKKALIVNATSLGLKADDPLPLSPSAIPSNADLYDMVYNPPITALMKSVAAKGGKSTNGITMLAFQGAKSLSHWTGAKPPTETMLTAALAAIN